MVNPQFSRGILEELHISYLIQNFDLTEAHPGVILSDSRPDLYPKTDSIPKFFFELKTRCYPIHNIDGRNYCRPKGQYSWWDLDEDQIKGHEKLMEEYDIEAHWILLLAHTDTIIFNMHKIAEGNILFRDILVLPWDLYKLVPIQKNNRRTIGLNKILDSYTTRNYPINKGTLTIAGNLENAIGVYFGLI